MKPYLKFASILLLSLFYKSSQAQEGTGTITIIARPETQDQNGVPGRWIQDSPQSIRWERLMVSKDGEDLSFVGTVSTKLEYLASDHVDGPTSSIWIHKGIDLNLFENSKGELF